MPPQFFPLQVVAQDTKRAEHDEDPMAVARGRRCGRPVLWMKPFERIDGQVVPPTLLAWVENGGTAVVASASRIPDMERNGIVILRGAEGTPRVRGMRLGRGRILQWTQPLAPQAMPELLEADFPERLWSLYAPPATPPARIDARAYAPRQGGRAWPAQPRDLTPLLVLVVAGLFLLERLFASGRREAVTA